MKKIMLLGGSAQQVVAIETAKRLGYFTVLCDFLTDNPGQYAADKFYLVSTTDRDAVLKVAEKEHIDGIVAYASDPAAPTAAYVAEKMGLFTNPYLSVETLCNKDKFRKFLAGNGFNTPVSAGYGSAEQAVNDIARFSFPVIIKPVDSSGSKGVTVLREPEKLTEAIEFAFSFSRCKRIIIEEFIEKAHPYLIGGDIFVWDGKVIMWGLMNCHRDEKVNVLVPVGKSYPPKLSDSELEAVKQTLQLMVDKLSIKSGAMNVELVVDKNGKVWPIDVGPRNGGNMIPDLLGYIFGVDVVEMTVKAAMGEVPALKINEPVPYYATHNLHTDKNGIFRKVVYSEQIRPYIIRENVYKTAGEPVEYFDNAAKALGIVFMKFDSPQAMHDILSDIEHHISIETEQESEFMSRAAELRKEFWADDAKNGGHVRKQYDEIKRVMQENDMDWVKERLRDIKLHAVKNTDFYSSFDPDGAFPVVTKSILTERHDEFRAKSGYLEPLHISSTSGSTGTPFSVEQDMMKRKRNLSDLKVFGELCDYPSHERMVFFRVLSEKLHRTPEQEDRENIYYVDSSRLDDERLEEMYQVLLEKKPRIIFSYSSTLVTLAGYIKEAHPNAVFEETRSVLTGGEGISEENRRLLAEVFGCKAYRRYSDMELGIMGQDNGDGGEYILNFGSYYFECLKTDSDEPAESGEVGRIVVTDLFNYAFPMIRYDTGDLGVMEYPDNGFPVLKEIYGRSRDCVYSTSDELISPAKISVSMWGEESIKQWQFIQNDRTSYTLKLNADKKSDYSSIIQKFKALLGSDADIGIDFVENIPVLASNKRKAIICNYTRKMSI